MKAILINDTRSNQHIGCNLVINNTLQNCKEAGINVIHTIQNNNPNPLAEIQKFTDYQCLLINGEGTMHHDRPLAIEFGKCAQWCKSQKKIVVLYNTVWQGNDKLDQYLTYFDAIFCRESFSANAIQTSGFQAKVVPDMVFNTPVSLITKSTTKKTTIAVLDAVRKKLSYKLGWLTVRKRYLFLSMSHNNDKSIQKKFFLSHALKIFSDYKEKLPTAQFIEKIALADKVISGRFHGTCLALLHSKPTASIASNTHKLEGLYYDIGLDPNLIIQSDKIDHISILSQWNACIKAMPQITEYTTSAPKKISSMFKEIRALSK